MPRLSEEPKAERARKRALRRALAAEADAVRLEGRHVQWRTEGLRLSWDELEAGVHCRGCGLPIRDGLGSWPVLLQLTAEQRPEYDAAEADYKARHGDCRSHRWSVEGSRTTHCGYCCPPPPLSPQQLDRLLPILRSAARRDPSDLATWQLHLTCDHVIEKQQHGNHERWTGQVQHCPSCDVTRGIVEAHKHSLPEPPVDQQDDARQAAELEAARQTRTKLETELAEARRRVAELERRHG